MKVQEGCLLGVGRQCAECVSLSLSLRAQRWLMNHSPGHHLLEVKQCRPLRQLLSDNCFFNVTGGGAGCPSCGA